MEEAKKTPDHELYDFDELFESLEAEVEKMKAIEILE